MKVYNVTYTHKGKDLNGVYTYTATDAVAANSIAEASYASLRFVPRAKSAKIVSVVPTNKRAKKDNIVDGAYVITHNVYDRKYVSRTNHLN